MTKFVPEEEFDAVTKEGFWIADFYTDHCGPCKILDVVLGQIIYCLLYTSDAADE